MPPATSAHQQRGDLYAEHHGTDRRHAGPGGGLGPGSSSTDNITDVTAPSFTVALDPTVVAGDTVQLLLAGTPLAHPVTHTITAAEVTAGSVSLAVTAGDLGADGGKAISAQFSDAVGNSSTTAALTITLDTTAPTVAITSTGGPTNQPSADHHRQPADAGAHGDAVGQRQCAARHHHGAGQRRRGRASVTLAAAAATR